MTNERPVSRSPAAMTALSAASMASTSRAPGAWRREGRCGGPDPGHKSPGVVRGRRGAPWDQGVAQACAASSIGQLDVALPVVVARGTGTPVAAQGEAVVHQVHRAAGQEPGQLRRQHGLANPARCMHNHGLARRGEPPCDLSGLRYWDDGLRCPQERRRGQELIRRGAQGREHGLRRLPRVRLAGGGAPGDVFLQPQRTVIRRSGQQGADILLEQVGSCNSPGARVSTLNCWQNCRARSSGNPRYVRMYPAVRGFAGIAPWPMSLSALRTASSTGRLETNSNETRSLRPGLDVGERREPAPEAFQGVLEARHCPGLVGVLVECLS